MNLLDQISGTGNKCRSRLTGTHQTADFTKKNKHVTELGDSLRMRENICKLYI